MGSRTNKTIQTVPSHLAIIPDGNRRWSSSHRLQIFNGYQKGIKKFIDFSLWAKGFGVKTLTVWALSTENIKNRSKYEINIICTLLERWSRDPALLKKLKDNGASVKIVGNLQLLPDGVKNALLLLQKKTKTYKDFTINVLIGYGGKDDLIYAFRKVCSQMMEGKIGKITQDIITDNMRTAALPDVDYIIRTSGEERLSGFLPWQSDYSELYFANKYWPDFDKKDLEVALEVFSQRKRRFGK
jgi:undecaprenyl diphosphate synthase